MIKFFRRIRQNLLMENKTGKYLKYAVGEIVLVVIGILIALQINTWNQQRLNNQKEHNILRELHKEFTENKKQLDTVVKFQKSAFKNSKKLIDLFPIDSKEVNLDSVQSYLNYAIANITFNPSQGTINSLISSSSFDLIKNDTLRKILIGWQDLIIDLQEDEGIANDVISDLLDPRFSNHFNYFFDLTDKRTNLKYLESMEFEYLINLRHGALRVLFREGEELDRVVEAVDVILELTKEYRYD